MSGISEQPAPSIETPPPPPRDGRDWRRFFEKIAPVLTLALLIAATALMERAPTDQHYFLKPENLINILWQWSAIGIIALGMTLVIISGGIDLSVGSLVALAGGLGIWVMNTVISAPAILQGIDDASAAGIAPIDGPVRAWLAHFFIHHHLDGNENWGVFIGIATILAVGNGRRIAQWDPDRKRTNRAVHRDAGRSGGIPIFGIGIGRRWGFEFGERSAFPGRRTRGRGDSGVAAAQWPTPAIAVYGHCVSYPGGTDGGPAEQDAVWALCRGGGIERAGGAILRDQRRSRQDSDLHAYGGT